MRRNPGPLGAISTATGTVASPSRHRRRSPLVLAVGALLGTLLVVVIPPPAPAAAAGLGVDRVVSVNTKGTATTAAFSTTQAGDLLVAFASADGPGGGGQTTTVSGGGLTWSLVRHTATQPGTADVWQAQAAGVLTGITVQSVEAKSGYDQSLTVVAFTGASGIGASTGASGASGVASVAVTTTAPNSLVYGVGNDWDSATARALGGGQSMVHEWSDTASGDDFWVEQLTDPVLAPAGVTLTSSVPTADRWNLSAVAIVPSGPPDTVAPSAPGVLSATGGQASASLSWGAATDNVAVTGYNVYRSTTTGFTPGAANLVAQPAVTTFADSGLAAGTYYYLVVARDGAGNLGPPSNEASATVTAPPPPPPPPPGPTVDKAVSVDVKGTATAPALSTAQAGELLLAFVSSDGPSGGGQTTTVSGGGLAWSLVRRTATQPGTTEVWKATAAAVLSGATVQAVQSSGGFDQSLTVVAFTGAAGTGASAGASGNSASASVALTTTLANSLVYAVGNDWDSAAARTLGSGQSMVHQWSDTAGGDGFWVQRATAPVASPGAVTLSSSVTTSDRWNLTGVEVTPAGPTDTQAPSAPGVLTATGGSGAATLSWGAATDNVAVVGYNLYRSTTSGFTPGAANQVAQPVGTTYSDSGLAAGTYYYRVAARDAAGNLGPASNEASATVTAFVDPRATTGEWAAPVGLPNIMQHAILLPGTSKILYFEDGAGARVVDATTGATTGVPSASNLFCAGHTFLSDGRPFVIGGDSETRGAIGIKDTNVFDLATNTWTRKADMSFSRWYPTATALPDGRVLAMSGSNNGCLTCFVQTPEIYDPTTNAWTNMASTANANIPYYPFDYVLPDGRLVQVGATEDATTTQVLNFTTQTWSTVDSRTIDAGSSTMYAPGKILKAGTASDGNTPVRPSSPDTWVLDMTASSPSWRQVSPMANPRAFLNLTSLPDGTVLATGGETTADGTNLANAVTAAESWSPTSETWSTLAKAQIPRLYHSVALLLPDGRVLVGGSGNDGAVPNELSYEIFSPPYLFKGPRPTITSAPSAASYGGAMSVSTPDAARISSAVLVAPAAVTHGFDENARRIPLTFSQASGGLTVQAPANGNLAPPGWYMLFLVDSNGVPSVASWVKVGGVADTVAPSAPGTLTGTGGVGTASLSWGAATDNLAVVGYNVYRSTTPGFTPGPANLVAQPTGTTFAEGGLAAGTYVYRVAARDAAGNIGPPSNELSLTVTTGSSGLAVDRSVSVDGKGTVTTAAFSTAQPGELLVALATSDGPSSGAQSLTVSGGGLTWTLVRRTNSQHGSAEVWQALASAALTNVTVQATQAQGGVDQSLTVVAFTGAAGVGASAGASNVSGAAAVALTTTAPGSLVFGAGNDWDAATARTLGTGQSMVHQWVDTGSGDTFWAQRQTAPITVSGTSVTLNATVPSNDRWNLTAVEIRAF